MTRSWFYLVLAIVTEVIGTIIMNMSGHSGELWMYALMYVFISASYVLLSFALRHIAVGIAIAIWEGLGTTLISVVSITVFHEKFSVQKLAGIGCALIGILLLRFGEKED